MCSALSMRYRRGNGQHRMDDASNRNVCRKVYERDTIRGEARFRCEGFVRLGTPDMALPLLLASRANVFSIVSGSVMSRQEVLSEPLSTEGRGRPSTGWLATR
jgi:hypothetical protein